MVAPIQKNTVPSPSTPPAAAAPAPARAPAAAAAPPAASDVRRQAADDVHTLQRTSAPAAPSASQVAYQRSVDRAVSTYLEGGGGPLRFQLGQDPAMLSALANVDPERLERDLEASFERQATGFDTLVTGLSAGGVVHLVESVANDRVRLGIVQEAQVTVNARINDLRTMRESLPELIPRLRDAAPGSPAAIQAQALGIRGDGGDLQRAQQAIDRSIHGLETFMGHMRGQAWWQTTDFPDATARVARRLNLGGAEEVVNAAAVERNHQNHEAHLLTVAAEVAHIGVEVGHALGSVAATAGLAVSVVGLVAGLVAHEFAEDVRQEHVTLGQSLGL